MNQEKTLSASRLSLLPSLKQQLELSSPRALVSAKEVAPKPGIPTGHHELNQFLLWKGWPREGLSLCLGSPGQGRTLLWAQGAAKLTQEKNWVAWLGTEPLLFPLAFQQLGIDLRYLWVISCPEKETYPWVLQELLKAELFSLIGCDLGAHFFRGRQWVKLQRQVRQHPTACVFLHEPKRWRTSESHFSLVLDFSSQSTTPSTFNNIVVRRALHRPTPQLIPRRSTHAHLMYQLAEGYSITHSLLPRRFSAL